VITNEELCDSYNAWARRENDLQAARIEAGEAKPIPESAADFIYKASGIKQRFTFDKEGVLDPARMRPRIPERADDELSIQAEWSVHAAKQALEHAGREGSDVDMVVLGAANVQRPYPAVAVEVQKALGASGFGFDMLAGCASTSFPIQLCADTIAAGHAKCALVINPELMSGHANFRDRDSHFIFGDAATATVVERLDTAKGANDVWQITDTSLKSSYASTIRNNGGFLSSCDEEHRDDNNKLFYQQGRRVFKDVVPMASDFMAEQFEKVGIKAEKIDRFWLHQANSNLNRVVMKRILGREATESEAPLILEKYGNTAAAGSIIAFHLHRQDLASGATGVICSFGAGYSMGSIMLRKL